MAERTVNRRALLVGSVAAGLPFVTASAMAAPTAADLDADALFADLAAAEREAATATAICVDMEAQDEMDKAAHAAVLRRSQQADIVLHRQRVKVFASVFHVPDNARRQIAAIEAADLIEQFERFWEVDDDDLTEMEGAIKGLSGSLRAALQRGGRGDG